MLSLAPAIAHGSDSRRRVQQLSRSMALGLVLMIECSIVISARTSLYINGVTEAVASNTHCDNHYRLFVLIVCWNVGAWSRAAETATHGRPANPEAPYNVSLLDPVAAPASLSPKFDRTVQAAASCKSLCC